MAKQVLFVQGGGKGAHDEWDNKLVASLQRELGPEYQIHYPCMPDEVDPSYRRWKPALEEQFSSLAAGTALVGHSIGATILINLLAEHPRLRRPSGIFLVAAPFIGEGGWPSDDIEPLPDLGARLPARTPVYLYHGSDDRMAPVEHVGLYERAIPQAIVRRLGGRDHQLNNDLCEVAADISALAGQGP
jgi:predicted alpha/beta hydrolase family esterase